MLIVVLSACSKGAKDIDTFFGKAPGDVVDDPVYTLTFEPQTYDFGPVLITDPVIKSKTITVRNTTGVTLFVKDFQESSASAFNVTNETCSLLTEGLVNNGSCEFTINFRPTVAGDQHRNVNFHFGLTKLDSSKNSLFIANGRGMTPASLKVTGSPTYDFGPVVRTATLEKQITMTNEGDWPATLISGSGLAAPFNFKGGTYPGTGGTCGVRLDGAATCSMVVQFTPPTTGLFGSQIDIAYESGDGAASTNRPVQGTGALPAQLAISDAPSYDFGTYAVGAVAERTFTINNSGGVPAASVNGSGIAAPFLFKGGAYPGTGGTCSNSIPAGASCQIVVTFSPGTVGTVSSTIQIQYNDGLTAQSITRAVQGTGVAPANLALSSSPLLDFGTQIVGSTNEQTLSLTNSGGFSASLITAGSLSAPFSYKGGAFPGTGGTCSTSLTPSSSCTIVLRYVPTTPGSFSGAVTISYNNGASAQSTSRSIQGNAVSAASLLISSSPEFDFGTKPLGSTTEQTLTVSNTGGTNASSIVGAGLATPYRYKGGTYPGTAGTCSTVIAPGATCTIVVAYAPTTTGASTSDAEITYFDGLGTQMSARTLKGNAVTPATLAVSDGPSYDFGSQPIGLAVDKTFTLTNNGGFSTSTMSGSGASTPFRYKGGSYPGSGGTCTTTLSAGASCTFVVTYQATAAGLSSATVTIGYNDGNTAQTSTRTVQGTGVTPANITISDTPVYDYGPIATGAGSDKSFTLTNTGAFIASTVTGAAFTGPFTFKGGVFPGSGGTCGASLAPAATCSVVVRFSPVALVSSSDNLTINYSNGVSSVSAVLPIQGLGTTPASLTISEGPSYNYGTLPTGAVASKSFTVSNSGGVSATGLIGVALGTPFTYVGGTYPGTGGTCTTSLSASSSCSLVVQFAPTAVNLFTTQLKVNYSDSVSAQSASRDLAGTGVLPASLAITPSPTASFGLVAVGGTSDLTITVSNSGGYVAASLNGNAITAPFSYKGGAFPGTGGTCTSTLPVSASCTIVATYSPTVTGAQNTTLSVSYFDGAASQASARTLAGSGAAPAQLAISESPTYDYGTIANGASKDRAFTITNSGGVSASSMTGSGLATPFRFKGGAFPGTGGTCTDTVLAGDSCSIVVSFAPVATGSFSGSVTVNYFDGASTQTSSRPMTGIAVNPALIAISNGPLYDFGTLAVSATAEASLTLTNSGAVNATGLSGAAFAAPFSFKGGSFPGVGGSCGGTLIPAATCTIVLAFSPSAVGSFNTTFVAQYSNGVGAATSSRDLQGAGAPAGVLAISDGPTYSFGTWPVGDTREKTLTVTNSGGVTTSSLAGPALAAPFNYKGGTYPGTGGTCAASLAPTATCTVIVQFAPTVTGTQNAVVNLTYNDGLTSQTSSRNVTGLAVPPASLTISDGPTYDFGTVPTGGTAEKSFTVSNTGGVSATSVASVALATPYSFKGGTFPGTGGTCTATIAASGSCLVTVVYSPTITGTQSSSITLNFNDGVNPQSSSRGITGTGANPALITISDSPTYTFPSIAVGSSADKTLTITNSGGVAASAINGSGLSAPFAFKGGTFPGTGGTCTTALAITNSCTIVVSFSPTAVATSSGSVAINYNNGVSVQASNRALAGTSVPAGSLTISDGATYDFGTVAIGAVVEKSFTVTNSGGYSASSIAGSGLTAPFAFKGGSYPGLGGSCGSSLAPSSTCSVIVTFTPTASGNNSGAFSLAYNDGAGTQTSARAVQGTGAAPASLAFADAPTYGFGTKATGSSTDKTLTLTNSGGVAATALSMSGLAAPFTYKGGAFPGTGGSCATTLAPSASCAVVVTYAPTATGSQNATLAASYANGVTTVAANQALTGTGAAPALIAITNGPTYDYGTNAVGAVAEKAFTLNNSGGIDATAVNGSGLAAPYAFKGGSFPGTAGTCTSTLTAGSSCTVVVTYSPSAVGTQTGSFDIGYFNGVSTQTSSRALTGNAVAPALLALSDGPAYDYGAVAVTGTVDKIISVTNNGSLAASSMNGAAMAPPFAFKGGTYPGTGGNCGAALSPAATCNIVVSFHPTVAGPFSTNAQVDYYDGAQAQSSLRALQGTGAPPASITISDGATYDFGPVAQNGTKDKLFTLTNAGGVPATAMTGGALAAPYSYKGGTYPGTGGTCAATLAATQTCNVVLSFSPTALGSQAATFALNFNDGLSAQTSNRPLIGLGVAPASLLISDGATYDFGIVATGGVVTKTFTVTNSGNFTATAMSGPSLAAPFSYKGGTYPGTGGTCAATLNVSASCSIVVNYSPTATGTQSTNISLSYYDGAGNQTTLRGVQGSGAAPSLLTVSDGATFDFGTLASGGTAEKTFTVTNNGGVGATAISGGGLSTAFSYKGGTFPGTGGTCTSTLSPATNCAVVVTFAPTTVGSFTSSIDISYNDGVATQVSSRAVQGVAVAPAALALSDGPTYNFNTVAIGAVAEKSLTLSNTGGFQASLLAGSGLSAPYSYKGGSYPGTGGTCSSSLNASASCIVVITFAPTSAGLQTSTAMVSYNSGAAIQSTSRAVQGTGAVAASLAITDAPTYNFGSKATGSTQDRSFTITNNGGVSATSISASALFSPFSYKGGTFPGTGGDCTATLTATQSCTVVVTYAPTATGAATNSVILTYSNGVGTVTSSVDVTGTGAAPALIGISDGPTFNFGNVATGGVGEKSFTLTNSGGINATALSGAGLSAPFTYKGGTFPGSGGTCTTILNSSATCTVIVSFSPAAVGSFSSSVDITYNTGVSSQTVSRAVQGNGVLPATLNISDATTYDFGAVVLTATLDKTFTITNSGSLTAQSIVATALSAPFSFKGGTFPGTGGNCGSTLNAAGTCNVVVTFSPTALGSSSANLNLAYDNGASIQNATRPMQGTGATAATLAISDGATYDFGAIANGANVEHSFTITNNGGVTATTLSGSGLSSPYSFKGGAYPGTGGTCVTTLAPAASCTVFVVYAPSTIGTQAGTLSINYQNGLSGQTSSRALTGTSVAPAALTLSDGPSYDFGTRATGSSVDKTFTLSNGGSFTASSIAGVGLSAPFTYKGGTFPGTGGNCTSTLTSSASCTLVVTYAPTATGSQSSTITVNYFNGASSQAATGGVQGTGAAPALLSLSDTPTYNFGSIAFGSTLDKTFTITNSGGITAASVSGSGLTAPYAFKGGTFPGTGGSCSSAISASTACTVVVTYAPTSAGSTSSTMTIAYNDGVSAQSSSVGVSGTASAPASLVVSDGPTYNFGNVANGSSNDKSLTVINGGGFIATGIAGSGLTAPYTFKGGSYPGAGGNCSSTLGAGASCTVVVNFAPTVSATANATLTLSFNDGVSAQTSTRSFTGISTAPAVLVLSDATTFDFGLRAVGSTQDKSFTLSNTGAFAASTIVPSGVVAPYSYKGGAFPGTGGNCTTTLAASSNCTIVITYAPTASGTQNITLSLAYNDGAAAQTSTRPITGQAASPSNLTITDGPTYDFGTRATGSTKDKSFTITNTGGIQATSVSGGGLAAPFTFKGGSYPGTGGTCAATLSAAATCTVVATYAPTANGVANGSLNIGYNDGVTTQTSSRPVAGTAVAPASLLISDGATFDFGSVATGGSGDKVFTLTNSGGLAAATVVGGGLGAPYTYKGGAFPGTGGNCGASLAAGTSCTFVVTFAPTADGSTSSTVSLSYDDGAQTTTAARAVQGTGAPPAVLALSDSPTYDFGTLANGGNAEKTLTITNSGGVNATSVAAAALTAPYSYKGGTFPGTAGTCTATVALATSCTIVIVYSPTTIANHNATVQINYFNGLTNVNAQRAVTGTAVAPAALAINLSPTYDYGSLATGASLDQSFTITNSGAFTASAMVGAGLAAPFTFKGGTYPGTGGNCSTTLAPAASCTVVVRWSPTATGAQSGTLQVNYNDGAQAQAATRGVMGTGVAPALITVSNGPSYDFGAVANGSSNDKSLTLNNTGGITATGLSGAGFTTPLTFKGGTFPGTGGNCSTTLAPAAACTVVITFAPTTSGSYDQTMTVTYNNGVSSQNSTRQILGTSSNPAVLAISNGPTYNFGNVANGSLNDVTLTVSNTGAFTASSIGGSGLTAPYSFKGGTYPGAGGNCSTTLSASATCTIVVTYAPTASATSNATVSLSYLDGVTSQSSTRALTGTSSAPAVLAISDATTYNFGSLAIGATLDKTFTISNTGSFTAASMVFTGAGAPFDYKGGAFPGTGGNCTTTLAASSSCTVVITWTPTATGSQSTTLSLAYNDGAAPQTTTRAMTGVGVAPALITISNGPSYNFGAVANGSSNDKSLTLTNTGGIDATSLSVAGFTTPLTFKGGTFPGTGGNCTTTLTPAAACTVVVTFAPTASGSYDQTMNVSYNNGVSTQSSTRQILGTSSNPALLTVSNGPTHNFGNVANGSVNDVTLTVTNTGAFTASSVGGSGLTAPFTFKGGTYPGAGGNCSTTLSTAATCTVVVTYAPTVSATSNTTLALGYNDGVTTQSSTRALTGTSSAPAVLAISDPTTYDFGSLAIGATLDKTFTITNSGAFTAGSMVFTGASAPFAYKGGAFPGTGGNCATTLAASSTCTVVITWTPTATGSQSTTLSLAYNDGAAAQTTTRAMTGIGVAPALITISNGPSYDFGSVANGSSNDKSLTLTNTGGIAATGLSVAGFTTPLSFKGGTFPGTGGNCGTSLAPSAACLVVVNFAPTTTGSYDQTMTVSYNNGVSGQSSARQILGASSNPAVLAISNGPTYNFGNVANGSVNDVTLTVTNTGNFTASSINGSGLGAPYSFKGGSFPGAGGNCSTTLATAGSCSIVVTYAPTASATATATVSLGYNDGVTTQSSTRGLTGTSTAPAVLAISDATTYSFGSLAVGATLDKTFTISNTGAFTASAMIFSGAAAPFNYKDGAFPGTGGNCAATLAASSTCTVVITWSPTATGAQSTTLSLAYNDGAAAQTATRPMTGTGVAPAAITITDGPTFDFGTRATGSTTDKTFTLNNTGGLSATALSGGGLAAPYTFKGGSYPGTGGSCLSSLAASGSCTVVVTYAPTANGATSSSLDISFNNGVSTQTSSRAVTGTGAAPAVLAISDGSTYDFGAVATGGSGEKIFSLTNTGGFTASTITGGGITAPYTYKNGSFPGTGGNCGATLAAGATCTFVVKYAPTVDGSSSAQVSISYNNGASTLNALRDLQGTGAPPASLAISDGPTYSYGSIANGGNAEKTFTVSNSGGVNATSLAAVALSAPYSFKGGTFPGTGGNCSAILNLSASCTMVVVYSPTSIATSNAGVQLNYFNGLANVNSTVNVTGSAVAPAVLAINQGPTYSYGSLATGSTMDASFTVTNTGNFTASSIVGGGLGAPFTYKGGTYPGTGGTCSASLAVSASCTVIVTWAPTATGAQSATIALNYFDGAQAQVSNRGVTGTGVAPALLTLSNTPTYDFGAVANGSVNDKTITVTNSGGIAASSVNGSGLVAPYSFKGGTFPGTGGSCSATLGAGAACTLVVTFAPSSTNSYSATMSIAYNNGVSGQSTTLGFTGSSSSPAVLTISDAVTYSYGNRANGSATDHTFTITNSGAFTSSSMSSIALTAPYSFKGGTYPGSGGTCALTLAGAGTCTVVVTYAPTASATSNQTLTLNYNDGVGAQSATRPMTGVSTAPALITASPTGTYDFGTLVTTTSADMTYTLTNSGGFDATTLTGTGLAAPFTFKGGSFPGTGGNCLATLAASSSCTVKITYAPTATGTQNATVSFTYNDGAANQTLNRSMIGTGAQAATITITDGPTYNFGTLATGASADKTLTLNNTGGFAATSVSGGGLTAPFSYKGGTFPGTGGNCTTSIAASAACTIVVTFAPSSNGSYSSSIDISFNNGVSTVTQSRPVAGASSDPALLTVSDGVTYDFGPVANNGVKYKTFTISNTGGVTASSLGGSGLTAPFSFYGGSFPGTGGTCGTTLAAGNNCTAVVQFAPTASGTSSATMAIGYNNGISAQASNRAIQGTGAPPAVITVSDGATYNYGTFANNASVDHTFTLSNTGGVQATSLTTDALIAPFSFKGGTYPGTGGTCNTTLNNGSTCTVVVTYSPTTVATHTGTLNVTYNDGLSAQSSPRALTGTAVAPALLTVSDATTYDFGTLAQGATAEHSFTITNSGNFAASGLSITSLSAPFSFKAGSYPGTGGTCTTSLAVSASCTIVVVYAPTGTGTASQSIDVAYNDGAQARTSSRPITGFSASPALLAISDAGFDYGLMANGSTSFKTFTVSNSGGVAATSLGGSGLTSPFTFRNGTFPGTGGNCTTAIPAGGNCTVVVAFAPTSTNSFSTTLTLNYVNGVSSQTANRAILGSSAPPAVLSITDGPTYNYGTVASGAVIAKTFTITNTSGSVTATTFNPSALAAPFAFKDGTFPGTGGTCSATLAGGSSCSVVVTFSPTAGGSFSDTVTLGYNDGVTTQSIARPVQGVGAPPASLTISNGATYHFNTVARGSINEFTFTITNTGGAAATSVSGSALLAPFGYKGGSFPGTGGTCTGGTINGSATCTVVVTYSPTVNAALDTGTLTLNYNTGVATTTSTRPVDGTAVNPALIAYDVATTFSFGKVAVGAVAETTATLTNNGSIGATSIADSFALAAPFTFKGGTYPGTGGSCGTSLAVGVQCSVVIRFAPTSTGSPSSNATLSYNNGASTVTATRTFTGVGATAAVLTVSDAGYTFGDVAVGATANKTFTVTNSGGVPATSINAPSIGSEYDYLGGVYPGTGGTCSTTLADTSGNTCTIVVRFSPGSVGNNKAGTISLGYTDGLNSQTATRAILGNGKAPASLTINLADPFAFGSVQTGYTLDQSFTVTNGGGVTATGMGITGLTSPFSFPGSYPGGGTCGVSLASGATCTMIVRFAPTTVGSQSLTFTLGYTTGAGTSTTTKGLSGVGAAPAAPTVALFSPGASPGTSSNVTIRVTSVVAGETVKLYRDNTCSGTQYGSTGTVPASPLQVDIADTIPAGTGNDGTYTYYATRTNANGTTSACSTGVSYIRDTTPPVLTNFTNQIPARSPHWTPAPTLRVTGVFAASDTIKIWKNSTCSTIQNTYTGVTTSTFYDAILSTLTTGHYTFYVTAQDSLGNITPCTSGASYNPLTYDYDVTNILVDYVNYFQAVTEGATVIVPVRLSAAKQYDVQVNYRATGTAQVGGGTSLSSSGSFTIPAGSTTYNLTFTATTNSGNQGNRYVDISLFDTNYEYVNVGGQVYHRVGINDSAWNNAPPVQMPKGYYSSFLHSCYIDNLSKLYCLGRALNGAVGDGTNVDKETYVAVAPTENFAKVVDGYEHSCALTGTNTGGTYAAGSVLCWGLGTSGQVGDGANANRTSPVYVSAMGNGNKDISVGQYFSCAIKSDETLWCWGQNNYRQVRLTNTTNSTVPFQTDTNLWTSISSGEAFACGIRKTTNKLFCWGRNYTGATGDGTTTDGAQTAMIDVDPTVQYAMVSTGQWTACAIATASDTNFPGQLRCWGNGNSGMQGRGNGTNFGTPASVDTSNKFSSVSLGPNQTCAITTSTNSPANTLRCAGAGDLGMLLDRLGAGNITTFQTIQLGTQFSSVTAGWNSTWAITTANTTLYGGYDNMFAASGDGRTTVSKYGNDASYYDQINTHIKLDQGGGGERATCSITSTNKIRCVGGISDSSMFGIGSAPDMTGMVYVDPRNDYTAVGSGRYATCAIRSDGKLYCAGTSPYNGTAGLATTLVAVDSANNYAQISMGNVSACGVLASGGALAAGTVRCWGQNGNAQLGDTTTSNRNAPVTADGGTLYSKISMGDAHTCGIVASTGRVRCWGAQNNGRLGNNTATAANLGAGVDLTDTSIYTEIQAGGAHTCGITGGKLKCWGYNGTGALGIGGTTDQVTAQPVDSTNDYLKVASGFRNTCAVRNDNKLFCSGEWTYGISGSLAVNNSFLQAMDSAFDFTDVTMGRYRGCGLVKTSNTVRCFGDGRFNSWGDFTRAWVPEALIAPGFIH